MNTTETERGKLASDLQDAKAFVDETDAKLKALAKSHKSLQLVHDELMGSLSSEQSVSRSIMHGCGCMYYKETVF